MENLAIILGVLFVISFFNNFRLKNKYSKIKTENNELKKSFSNLESFVKNIKKELSSLEHPKREGFYTKSCTQGGKYSYVGVVTVEEIDRYQNGKSKIRLKNIELTKISNSALNQTTAIEYIKDDFSSIKSTDKIEWLESVIDIKEERYKKISKIKELFKDE